MIRLPQDIFNLDYIRIEDMDGWGKQSVLNLKYSINARKNITFDKFIYALGIRHIGLENAKLISKNLNSSKNFISFAVSDNFDELLNLDGIGETQINSIRNFFKNKTNIKILNELNKILSIKNSIKSKKNGPFKDKTFLLTGMLEGMSRAEAKSLIEQIQDL